MSDGTNQKVVKNTIYLYLRMLLIMGVTLFTSRIVLQSLGIEDFGINNVVGGVIGLLGFVSSSMSISVQRYLSYSIGQSDDKRTNSIFSMSINIHVLIAFIVGGLLLIFGGLIIKHFLDIPANRLNSTIIFFYFITLTSCFQILQVPFIGLIIAQERMGVFALISILEAICKLAIAYIIFAVKSEKLIIYGIFLSVVSFLIFLSYLLLVHLFFKNIRYRLEKNNSLFKELTGFASWSALGEIGWAFTIQGVGVLMNHFFGVISNAAYGVANQISVAVNKFVSSFQTALNPQIIKHYAQGEVESSVRMTFRGIKFSYLLIFIISLPCLINMDYILRIWLGTVPEYAVIFSRLILIGVLIDSLSNLFATIVKANGHIKNYQITVSIILASNFPISYIAYALGLAVTSALIIYWVISIFLILTRMLFVSKIVETNLFPQYLKSVLVPVILTSILCSILEIPIFFETNALLKLAYSFLISIFLFPIIAYFVGLSKTERQFINSKIKSLKMKIK